MTNIIKKTAIYSIMFIGVGLFTITSAIYSFFEA